MNKASETRARNKAAQEEKYRMSQRMKELVTGAIVEVLESPTTTPVEKLRAVELWEVINGRT